jgi:curved DNA-binding protein CbpA
MAEQTSTDYYELLQISPNAETDTIHRVYRLLAQRFHPDNQETGDARKFRQLHDAYMVLSDPEKRAQFDVFHQKQRGDRWRLVSAGERSETDVDAEKLTRLTVLEVLYTRRRVEPQEPGIFDRDMEQLIGRPREHLEFTYWYLMQKGMIARGEQSRLLITAHGVDYLEENYGTMLQRRRLPAASQAA